MNPVQALARCHVKWRSLYHSVSVWVGGAVCVVGTLPRPRHFRGCLPPSRRGGRPAASSLAASADRTCPAWRVPPSPRNEQVRHRHRDGHFAMMSFVPHF
jgi:hypothetical protein